MPNVAAVFKVEIARVARKEARTEVAALKKSASSHRADLAALKRRIVELENGLRKLEKLQRKSTQSREVNSEAENASRVIRFSAKGLASQRKRLGLSANELGLLIGASGQSIYNWEAGSSRPRESHVAAIAGLKSLGKKSAAARLAEIQGS